MTAKYHFVVVTPYALLPLFAKTVLKCKMIHVITSLNVQVAVAPKISVLSHNFAQKAVIKIVIATTVHAAVITNAQTTLSAKEISQLMITVTPILNVLQIIVKIILVHRGAFNQFCNKN
jgi:hypothetical protein